MLWDKNEYLSEIFSVSAFRLAKLVLRAIYLAMNWGKKSKKNPLLSNLKINEILISFILQL